MITSSESRRPEDAAAPPDRSRMLLPGADSDPSEDVLTGGFGRIPGGVSGVMPGGLKLPPVDCSLVPAGFLIFISGMVAGGGRVVLLLVLGVTNGASVGLSATGAFGAMRRISTAGRPPSWAGEDAELEEDTMSDIFVTLTVAGGRSRFGMGFFVDGISFV